jgi:anti-sigma B factor antagonist
VAVEDQLRINVQRDDDRVVLGLHGELDLAGAPRLQSEIETCGADSVGILVLDLRNLQFIDSAGLRVILAAHESSRQHKREFALTRGPQQVQRLLSIAGVDEYLRIISSPHDQLV